MFCQECGCDSSKVICTATDPYISRIYRQRKCLSCGHRWYTYEIEVISEEDFKELDTILADIRRRRYVLKKEKRTK